MMNNDMYTPDFGAFERLAGEGYNLIQVYREISADLETPVSAFIKVARGRSSFLLDHRCGPATGRRGSAIHSLQDPAYRRAPSTPATARARSWWAAVTPDPQ